MSLIQVIQGSFHQGSGAFMNAGSQCTAIALFALATIFMSQLMPQNFSTQDIDNIVIGGDHLYHRILHDQGYAENTYLGHTDIPEEINLGFTRVRTAVYTDMLFGVVGNDLLDTDAVGAVSLYDALETGFYISDFVIATFEFQTVALVQRDGSYFVFDSHARNCFSHHDAFGTACLLQFSSLEALISWLSTEYNNNMYNVSPIIFELVKQNPFLQLSESEVHSDIDNSRFAFYSEPDYSESLVDSHSYLLQQYYDNNFNKKTMQNEIDKATSINVLEHFVKSNTNDHSYSFPDKRKRKKKNIYKNCHGTKNMVVVPDLCVSGVNLSSHVCELNSCTIEPMNICENISQGLHVASYETVEIFSGQRETSCLDDDTNIDMYTSTHFFEEIRNCPNFVCVSCENLFYDYQIKVTHERFSINGEITINEGDTVCSSCLKELKIKTFPKLSVKGNKLAPGIIPKCLLGLSMMEKRLISQIQVFMTVLILPGGQLGERGLAIDFPIDIADQLKILPRAFADSDIVAVSYEGSCFKPKPSHLVRKEKILEALYWLKENNVVYKNITIDSENIPYNIHIRNDELTETESGYDEYGAVLVNYTTPDTNLAKLINSSTPLITMEKCVGSPKNAYHLEKGEEMAFPHLFPYGQNGFKEKRTKFLSHSKYFQHRMMFKDGRFRKDLQYLLHAVNYYEYVRLLNSVSIHMRMRRNAGCVTAADVTDLTNNPDLLKNSYLFMKNIKGTAAYWKNNLLNLLAIFKSLGPPSLFVTLSANDMHWPDLIMTLTGCDYKTACSFPNALEFVKKDPVLTAIHFQRRFNLLMKNVIQGPNHPLGKVQDHFGRIEFQNRGSPHVHLFFWIENFQTISSNQENLISYIDRVISVSRANCNASKFQMHRHSDYCQKRPGKCRFGFPFKQCEKTHLLTNVDMQSLTTKGKCYELKRSSAECYINAYNPVILHHWQANMDIQVVGNSESAAYYVCSYICKSEPEDLKVALSKLLSNLNSNMSLSQRNRMLKIGSCVLKTRKLSAQEAAYRLLPNLNLITSSRAVLSLNTKPPAKRYRVLKSKQDREQLSSNSTDIFCCNSLDYYRSRPYILENVCFYDFSQWYVKCSNSTDTVRFNSLKQERIRLLKPFQDTIMRKRVKSLVIRLPKYSISSDDYFYNLLLSFLPHRDESEILQKTNNSLHESAREAFISKQDKMSFQHLSSVTLLDEIENAIRFIQCSRIELACSASCADENCDYDSEIIQANISIPLPSSLTFETNDYENLDGLSSLTNCNEEELYLNELELMYHSRNELFKNIQDLTKDQKTVMKFIMDHFQNIKSKEPFHIFITGSGGVGKSHLTNIIVDWLKCCTTVVSGKSPVEVCAPTGTAAKHIHGITLHHALCLPVQHGNQPNFFELSGKKLKQLRARFSNIHTIIIDEISMVSSKILDYVHRRLMTIKDCSKLFGGLNVIAVGDLLQLRPVKGKPVFENVHLWSNFRPFFLQENVRQSSNLTYASLLNRARLGLLTKNDTDLLKSRLIHPIPLPLDSILHLFPTVRQVENHNIHMQSLVAKSCIEIYAKHYYSPDDTGNKQDFIDEDTLPSDDREAGGLRRKLRISVGSRVMLIRNIFTRHGLVNGALGYVESFQMNEPDDVRLVYVKFDNPEIGRILQNQQNNNAIAIEPICQEIIWKGRIIIREQFPLILAWACTIHKVQGASLKKAAVSLGNEVFEPAMGYVALSRVKSIEGLYLLALNEQKIYPSSKAIEECSRLRSYFQQ